MKLYHIAIFSSFLILAFGSCTKKSNDTIKPWIELKGNNPVYSEVGKPYNDAGAIVWDVNASGDTVDISSRLTVTDNINTEVVGKYEVHYNATDDAGNSADEVIRTVNILIFK